MSYHSIVHRGAVIDAAMIAHRTCMVGTTSEGMNKLRILQQFSEIYYVE